MITNHDTAKLVSETLQRFRAEMREIHPSVEQSCSQEDFRAYNSALSGLFITFMTTFCREFTARTPIFGLRTGPSLARKRHKANRDSHT